MRCDSKLMKISFILQSKNGARPIFAGLVMILPTLQGGGVMLCYTIATNTAVVLGDVFATDLGHFMGISGDDIREDLSEQCGLPMALAEIGEKWSLMILRAAFNGVRHFEEFLSEMGIARNILASRLVRLTESGILERNPCPDDRRRVEYSLTQKGRDLLPAMVALRQWGEKWQLGVPSNPVLVDARDLKPVQPMSIRSHDDRLLHIEDLCWIDASDRDIANPASRRDLEQHAVVPAGAADCC